LSTSDKVGLAANAIAIAGGVITAVTFVTTHWDAIRNVLSTMGIAFVTKEEWATEVEITDEEIQWLAREAKRLSARSREVLTGQIDATAEYSRLAREFSVWFNALPQDIQDRTRLEVGHDTIGRLLG
jgi:hypothetical protein